MLIIIMVVPSIMFQTLLVTGGSDGGYLSSTELLEETATSWVLAGELPTPRIGFCLSNIDNRVLSVGNYQVLNSY